MTMAVEVGLLSKGQQRGQNYKRRFVCVTAFLRPHLLGGGKHRGNNTLQCTHTWLEEEEVPWMTRRLVSILHLYVPPVHYNQRVRNVLVCVWPGPFIKKADRWKGDPARTTRGASSATELYTEIKDALENTWPSLKSDWSEVLTGDSLLRQQNCAK